MIVFRFQWTTGIFRFFTLFSTFFSFAPRKRYSATMCWLLTALLPTTRVWKVSHVFKAIAGNNDLDDGSKHAKAIVNFVQTHIFNGKIFARTLFQSTLKCWCKKVMVVTCSFFFLARHSLWIEPFNILKVYFIESIFATITQQWLVSISNVYALWMRNLILYRHRHRFYPISLWLQPLSSFSQHLHYNVTNVSCVCVCVRCDRKPS